MDNNALIIAQTDKLCRCCGKFLESRTRRAQIQTASDGRTREIEARTVLLCTNEDCGAHSVSFMDFEYETFDLSPFVKRSLLMNDTQCGGGAF
jgi:hypothetical protein